MTTPEPDPRSLIDRLIAEHARSGKPFSANAIRPHLDRDVQARNLLTPRLQAAERTGLIVKIGTTRSDHREGKARILALYRGAGVPVRLPDRDSLRRKAQHHRVTLIGDLTAAVESDHQVHEVTRRRGVWFCACTPSGSDCSHVIAVALLAGDRP